MRQGINAIIKQLEKLEEERVKGYVPDVIIDFTDYEKNGHRPRYYRGDTMEEIEDEAELEKLCKAQKETAFNIFWSDDLPKEPVKLSQHHIIVETED